MKQGQRFWIGGLIAGIFLVLFVLITYKYLWQVQKANDGMIAQQIQELQHIFVRINKECKITGFRNKVDEIDFLTVKSFTGSEVGSMNLLAPQNWQGPYVTENPTMQGKEYQIIGTQKGYYIVPGRGVTLFNGKEIGKSLIISPDSDIEAMIRNPQALLSGDVALAGRLETYQG